jgi:2-polyprenyl-3-methyl-5-hydroxy-6-metoxy-1,4-benzoquinol methylase
MPHSAEEGRDIMVSWMMTQNPKSVLDIGVGAGTYARPWQHLTTTRPFMIGIEAWEPYVAQFDLRSKYDHLMIKDVRDLPYAAWPRTDIVILGDVLEHMDRVDAIKVWTKAYAAARKAVYLSIPIVHCPQGPEHGNPFEAHVIENWNAEQVLHTFPGITWHWHGSVVGRYEAQMPS